MDEAGLLKLKRQIDEAKQSSSELKGQLNALTRQLKDDWKCNSVEEAERLIVQVDKEINTLNDKIDEGLKELGRKYETKN